MLLLSNSATVDSRKARAAKPRAKRGVLHKRLADAHRFTLFDFVLFSNKYRNSLRRPQLFASKNLEPNFPFFSLRAQNSAGAQFSEKLEPIFRKILEPIFPEPNFPEPIFKLFFAVTIFILFIYLKKFFLEFKK